jgi:hypothetical protein
LIYTCSSSQIAYTEGLFGTALSRAPPAAPQKKSPKWVLLRQLLQKNREEPQKKSTGVESPENELL